MTNLNNRNDNFQSETHQTADEFFGETIYTYTRKDAFNDGVLVDVSEIAKELGFNIPVALTSAVYEDCVKWSEQDTKRQTYQDEPGRLHDVLSMAHIGARVNRNTDTVFFKLYRVIRGGRSTSPKLTTLKMMIHGGDNAEPVITISEPNED